MLRCQAWNHPDRSSSTSSPEAAFLPGAPTGQTIEIVETGEPASVKQGAGLKGSLHLFRATPQPVLRASTKEG